MPRLERDEFSQRPFVPLWGLLGFQAGYINAFGFAACGRYVSHVTGFGTQIGIALAKHESILALELLGMPVFFSLGAFLSGLITSAKIEKGEHPRFDLVVFSMPFMLLLLVLMGDHGSFGVFGEKVVLDLDIFLLYLLSIFCGMQNGCFAVLTKGQIRTTHLTGISTDLGTDLARIWSGQLKPLELALTKRINFCRLTTFGCFGLGSIASIIACQYFQYRALFVPLASSILIFLWVRAISRQLEHRFEEGKKMSA